MPKITLGGKTYSDWNHVAYSAGINDYKDNPINPNGKEMTTTRT